ncbi:ras-related protein Rab-40B-like [Panonychus citri]|uniref:ras-related protein Rab-40B-like n=1 Tax=Panonychus citri TaxID=50023 RepID=UPI0023074AC0|nr:ras-related protein Rab-40B-like [Panonychus citri]
MISDQDSSISYQGNFETTRDHQLKGYDYLLKFLLVGDPDVGKDEIMNSLDSDVSTSSSSFSNYEQHFSGSPGVAFKSTQILLDGKRIRLQLWDASGQGRFSTIIRSYSRGAQGILLVYDITNKWSFSGLKRWLREVEEHAPGVPKILVGNRLHLAFQRQVNEHSAENYANRYNMSFFEVSPLCNYNIRESFAELSRMVLLRNGMENVWRRNTVLSLREICCRSIVACTTVYGVEQLPLPPKLKCYLKSYSSLTSYTMRSARSHTHHSHSSTSSSSHKYKDLNNTLRRKAKALFSCDTNKSHSSNRLHNVRGIGHHNNHHNHHQHQYIYRHPNPQQEQQQQQQQQQAQHHHSSCSSSTNVDCHQKNCVIS